MFELFVVLVVVVTLYVLSLKINPYTRCSRCNGNPRKKGLLFRYAHHSCSKCNGLGQQRRLGHRILFRGPSG